MTAIAATIILVDLFQAKHNDCFFIVSSKVDVVKNINGKVIEYKEIYFIAKHVFPLKMAYLWINKHEHANYASVNLEEYAFYATSFHTKAAAEMVLQDIIDNPDKYILI